MGSAPRPQLGRIDTVAVQPAIQSLIVAFDIVLIRTFFSFLLEVETDARLPWRKSDDVEADVPTNRAL